MSLLINDAVSRFGKTVTERTSASVTGEPEEQLRGPLEILLADLAELIGFNKGEVTSVGESAIEGLHD